MFMGGIQILARVAFFINAKEETHASVLVVVDTQAEINGCM